MSKKLFFSMLAGTALVLFLAGCGDKENEEPKIALKSINVSPAGEVALIIGETQPLTATAEPENASDVNFQWTSASTAIATVSGSGLVTAVGEGTTTVTVTSGSVKTDIPVTVTAAAPDLISFTVTPAQFNLKAGDEPVQLEVQKTPANAGGSFTYQSGNTGVVTVSETGLVTVVGSGLTTVTVTSGDLPPVTVPVGVASQIVPVSFDWGESISADEGNGFFTITVTDPPADPKFFTTGLGEALTGTSAKVIFECITNGTTNEYGPFDPERYEQAVADGDDYQWADWGQMFFYLAGWAAQPGMTDFIYIPKCDDWTEIAVDVPSEAFAGGFGSAGDFFRFDPVGRGGNWNNYAIAGYEITIRNLRIVVY
jgi:hypothetical protein